MKKSIVTVIGMAATLGLLAQTPSEIRKQKQKEEQEKNSGSENLSPSERRKQQQAEQVKSKVFDADDPHFSATQIPDKWKNESGVVIAQKYNIEYDRNSSYVEMTQTAHRRIKLLDKAAISAYSEFRYQSTNREDFAVKVIKADGKVNDIDIGKAVEVPREKGSYGYYYGYTPTMKLAIPDLEAGDIIDYYIRQKNVYLLGKENAFPMYTIVLSDEYPIMHQDYEIKVDRFFFINAISMNGAPELKEVETDVNKRRAGRQAIFRISDSDREKAKDTRWLYDYRTRELATIKFQVLYVSPSKYKSTKYWFDPVNKTKNSVSREEIVKMANFSVTTATKAVADQMTSQVIKELKKKKAAETDPEKIAEMVYYQIRSVDDRNYYGLSNLAIYSLFYNKGNSMKISDNVFAAVMFNVLKKYKIPAEVLVGADRRLCKLDQIISPDELYFAVKAGNRIYSCPSRHSTHFEINTGLQGMEMISFIPNRNYRMVGPTISKVSVPVDKADQNRFVFKFKINIDENFEHTVFERTTQADGLAKSDYYPLILVQSGYSENDKRRYDPRYKPQKPPRTQAEMEERRKEDEARKETKKKLLERLKESAGEDYEIESFDDFKLLASGRYPDSSQVLFLEKFKVKGLVEKAGRNYVLQAGMFIGEQLQIKESELKRENNIYMDFPRMIENEIVFTIPDGYKVEGIEALNMKTETEGGSFESSARVEGNQLIISTKKKYPSAFLPAESWGELVKFLDTAYQFTQKKVVLKKA